MINPTEFQGVFGKSWVDTQTAPLLRIGQREWTRYELVSKVGVGNYRAITILMDALQQLQIRTMRDLWALSPVALAGIKGVGVTTLFVTMSLLDSEEFDVKQWYSHHHTFGTLKAQEKKKAEVLVATRRRRRRKRP